MELGWEKPRHTDIANVKGHCATQSTKASQECDKDCRISATEDQGINGPEEHKEYTASEGDHEGNLEATDDSHALDHEAGEGEGDHVGERESQTITEDATGEVLHGEGQHIEVEGVHGKDNDAAEQVAVQCLVLTEFRKVGAFAR